MARLGPLLILHLPGLRQFWFVIWQTCGNSEFTMARHVRILVFHLTELRQFWNFTYQFSAKSDFYLPGLRQFWFFTWQTCANSEFSLARIAPIFIFHLPDLRQFWNFTCQTSRAEVSNPSPPLLSEIKGVKPFPLLKSRKKSVRV